jgi:hypothetical protein
MPQVPVMETVGPRGEEESGISTCRWDRHPHEWRPPESYGRADQYGGDCHQEGVGGCVRAVAATRSSVAVSVSGAGGRSPRREISERARPTTLVRAAIRKSRAPAARAARSP